MGAFFYNCKNLIYLNMRKRTWLVIWMITILRFLFSNYSLPIFLPLFLCKTFFISLMNGCKNKPTTNYSFFILFVLGNIKHQTSSPRKSRKDVYFDARETTLAQEREGAGFHNWNSHQKFPWWHNKKWLLQITSC